MADKFGVDASVHGGVTKNMPVRHNITGSEGLVLASFSATDHKDEATLHSLNELNKLVARAEMEANRAQVPHMHVCVRACGRACACVRACMRTCMRACA